MFNQDEFEKQFQRDRKYFGKKFHYGKRRFELVGWWAYSLIGLLLSAGLILVALHFVMKYW